MRKRRLPFVCFCALLLLPIPSLAAQGLNLGTGMWARFSHGPSTFQLTPGASLTADMEILPDLRLGAKVLSGALLGYATGLEVSAAYSPSIGPWMPGIGIAAQGMFVSTVFYYSDGGAYVDVGSPEWSAGIALQPLRFVFKSFGISALEIVAGTDLALFGKILIVDVELFRVFIPLGEEATP